MTPATPGSTPLPPAQWKSRVSARYAARADFRQLLVIEHPWLPSRAGGSGEWETTVVPPGDWRPGMPLYLSFYQSDNYLGPHEPNPWLGAQSFVGHRFKQLLVNGNLVWESDVADVELAGETGNFYTVEPGAAGFHNPYRVIEITPRDSGPLTVTFRVVDKVASTERLSDDDYRRFAWSAHDPAVASRNFSTTVYFGDVHLTIGTAPVRPAGRPPRSRNLHAGRGGFPAAGIPFAVETPGRLPAPGFPVRSGVPLPVGILPAGTPVRLQEASGADVPAALTETSYWPDGSVRWLLCEFVARSKAGYRLQLGKAVQQPEQPVRLLNDQQGLVAAIGPLTLTVGTAQGAGVFNGVRCVGGPDLGALELSITLNRVGWRERFAAIRTGLTIERDHPVCAVIRLDGAMMNEQGARFGSWHARLHLWAGLPYLQVEWTLVNESDQAMAMLLDWSARIPLPDLADARVDFGPFHPGYDPQDIAVKAMGHYGTIASPRKLPLYRDSEFSCRQERENQARLYRNTTWVATAETAEGFCNLQHPQGGLVAAMRWFAEEYPTGLVVRPDLLKLATLPESEDAVAWGHDRPFARIGRGEAKRQVFALWLHDGTLPAREAERFNRCVQDAPRLWNHAWGIASGALEAGASRRHPKLAEWGRKVAPWIEWTGIGAPRRGHREYWDTAWSNDYRGRTHLGLLQYAETGDPRWFRYFDAAVTHNRDIDIIHFCPEHPDWVGACHGYGEDHTTCYPMGNIGMNCDGMLEHYLLTGDPDSLAAARGLAERLLLCVNERCARTIGWPLSQLVRWYEQSGDARFLDKARELESLGRAYLEPRRGIFPELHGCWNYPGTVAFMAGYLAFGFIRYHRLTGSPETLDALARLATGFFAESWKSYGRFTYSPFPENNPLPSYHHFNPLIGGLTGYLYLVTGETRYRDWTRECYDGMIEADAGFPVSMDMFQIAGYMLQVVARR